MITCMIILYILGMIMANMAATVAIEKHSKSNKGKAVFVIFWPVMSILYIAG